jgi:hypothetical protein
MPGGTRCKHCRVELWFWEKAVQSREARNNNKEQRGFKYVNVSII